MEKVVVDDVDHFPSTASIRRPVADAIGAEGFALNYYELDPGDRLSTALHTHLDQEEAFYVLSGTVTFDTDDGEVTVGGGEAIRFAPGEYQHGYNEREERATLVAIGAPQETSDSRSVCPHCGTRGPTDIRWTDDRSVRVFECPECGEEIARQT